VNIIKKNLHFLEKTKIELLSEIPINDHKTVPTDKSIKDDSVKKTSLSNEKLILQKQEILKIPNSEKEKEEKERRHVEEKTRREAEDKARKEVEEKIRKEAEEKSKKRG